MFSISFHFVLLYKLNFSILCVSPCNIDMGNGQPDDSRQVITGQQPALNTTKLVMNQLNETDVVLHIGDISYARGYASVVRHIQ